MISSKDAPRAVLFVPAINLRALEKARTLTADALIFDLEDAVGPEDKVTALANLVGVLERGGFHASVLAVRIPRDTSGDTLFALSRFIEAKVITAIVVPKVRQAPDLIGLAEKLPRGTPLWVMIETAMAVVNLREIASLQEIWPLEALILGPNDLRSELRSGNTPERTELLPIISSLIVHARAFGLLALDGVYNAYQNPEGFERECRQGKLLGFDGKTLIHPSQIAMAEAAFGPTDAELAWAQRVIEAFARPENRELGVISVGGEMIERLHLDRAGALLAQTERAR